jgi:hypothetical protein
LPGVYPNEAESIALGLFARCGHFQIPPVSPALAGARADELAHLDCEAHR